MTEKEFRTWFAKTLNKIMRDKNLSDVALAKGTGISRTTIGKWAKGEATPSLYHATQVFGFLKTSLGVLDGTMEMLYTDEKVKRQLDHMTEIMMGKFEHLEEIINEKNGD